MDLCITRIRCDMFYIDYRGFRVYYNGSATFNVFLDDFEFDVFTRYVNCDRTEAARAIFEWIDQNVDSGEYSMDRLVEYYGV